jgi:hypothetical protein
MMSQTEKKKNELRHIYAAIEMSQGE